MVSSQLFLGLPGLHFVQFNFQHTAWFVSQPSFMHMMCVTIHTGKNYWSKDEQLILINYSRKNTPRHIFKLFHFV